MIRRTSTATGYQPDSPDVLTCTLCKSRASVPRLQTVVLSASALHACGVGWTLPDWDPTPPKRGRPVSTTVVESATVTT